MSKSYKLKYRFEEGSFGLEQSTLIQKSDPNTGFCDAALFVSIIQNDGASSVAPVAIGTVTAGDVVTAIISLGHIADQICNRRVMWAIERLLVDLREIVREGKVEMLDNLKEGE